MEKLVKHGARLRLRIRIPGGTRVRFLRVLAAILGFGALGSSTLIIPKAVSDFALWKLLLGVLTAPGAVLLLFYAFRKSRGAGGMASAHVTWPPPSRPPVLVGAAGAAIPQPPEWLECRGSIMPRSPEEANS